MEQFRKYVYCDIDFLRSTIYPNPEESYSLKNVPSAEFLIAIRNLLLNPFIVLFLNIDEFEFDAIIKQINKKRLAAAKKGKEIDLTPFENAILDFDLKAQENTLRLRYISSSTIDDIINYAIDNNDWYDAIILRSDDITEEELKTASDYGLMVICPKTWTTFQKLITDNGCAVRKKDNINWENCIKIRNIPCNYLTLIDNYILNETVYLEENIKPILNTLLPNTLNKELVFQISIFTALTQNRLGKRDSLDPSIRIKKLHDIINQIRPSLNYEITVFKCDPTSFHDRCIITNNLWISCGAGFDLLHNSYATKHTTINVLHPFLSISSPWTSKAVSNMVGELKERVRQNSCELGINNVSYTFPIYSVGSRNLRILSD